MRAPKVAVIGLGYWGPNLVRVISENRACQLSLCCDMDSKKLGAIQRRYPSVRVSQSVEDVWASDADAVVIATPVKTHGQLAIEALCAGKHVLVEKPLAAGLEESERVVEEARRHEKVLMVGHTFLFSPPVLRVKDLIDSREAGDIYYISSSRVNLGLYQRDIDVLWDLGPHDVSILLYWLGEIPCRVHATGRSCVRGSPRDVVFLTLEFPSGVLANLEMSWLAPNKLRRTVIVGSKQMLVYDDTQPSEKLRIYDKGVSFKQPDTFGEYQLTYRTGNIISPPLSTDEPLAREIAHFLECIQNGTESRSGPQLGVEVVRVLDWASRSLKTGVPYVASPVLDVKAH